MAKQLSSKNKTGYCRPVSTPPAAKKLNDRNLTSVSPKKQQFEPTPDAPVRQHIKMAGG